ncbi:MAG: AAA family ATPase [Planctomycetota bacterium]|nr:AAA family ATPase [Planctomycetota bacterium]
MLLNIPVYIEVKKERGGAVHHCQPLFVSNVTATDSHLGLAMSKLTSRLHQLLSNLGASDRHDLLAQCSFSPDLKTHVLSLALELRSDLVRVKLLFVTFQAVGRIVALCPAIPELCFELRTLQDLESRATHVFTRHFRKQEKAGSLESVAPVLRRLSLSGQAWVTAVEIDVKTRHVPREKIERKLAALFDDTKVDGATELQRVGRCLDYLYPGELHEALGRDSEVELLDRLLREEDNRPVVLVGPRLVGKSAILHQCVRRRVERRGKPYVSRKCVWQVSPQRLISGMMYVGQWEGRVQAILKEVRKRKHVLYIDDLLGLYHVGQSRDANLSIADMVKPSVLRREVRLLAELTTEAWQLLQEKDRGLADQFHVIRIAAMGESETRRVMLQVQRRLESTHRCEFSLDALPVILRLHEAYIRDAAFPGKSAAFSRQLAHRREKLPISRDDVEEEFHRKTGLALDLLDGRRKLERDEVISRLRTSLVGQSEAVSAAADVVLTTKSRLSDPRRPIATLLFLGPTGVGKTQCAKALAETLFTDPARLLRFDMNEFSAPWSAAQLAGTAGEPDGLLAGAVRRQPFSVVLLDEIEKAHPNVFDLLLQVTGEGRLTDALGRTADFTNTVIVMTSNLGADSAAGRIGLAEGDDWRQRAYHKAAEAYFRPEFFNRIDRIVPFTPLSRPQMREVADLVLRRIFERDGLVRRRVALSVEPLAMERIVDAGYHPKFGARALQRAIESQLVQPVAARLAEARPDLPSVITVYPQPGGVATRVVPLEGVAPVPFPFGWTADDPELEWPQIEQVIARVKERCDQSRVSGVVSGTVSVEQLHYFAVREQLMKVQELREQVLDQRKSRMGKGTAVGGARVPGPVTTKAVINYAKANAVTVGNYRNLNAARDIHDYLNEVANSAPRPAAAARLAQELCLETAWLATLQSAQELPIRALVIVRSLVYSGRFAELLCVRLGELFELLGFDVERLLAGRPDRPSALLISGVGVWPLVSLEHGIHVMLRPQENLFPFQVTVRVADETPFPNQVEQFLKRRADWLAGVATGRATIAEDPDPPGRLLRVYNELGATLDLRTGQSTPGFPSREEHRRLLLSALEVSTL